MKAAVIAERSALPVPGEFSEPTAQSGAVLIDVDTAGLSRQGTVTLPASIQYAWPHPSKQYLYVVSSDGGPGSSGAEGRSDRILARTGQRERHEQALTAAL